MPQIIDKFTTIIYLVINLVLLINFNLFFTFLQDKSQKPTKTTFHTQHITSVREDFHETSFDVCVLDHSQ